MRRSLTRLPTWASIGLACFFGTVLTRNSCSSFCPSYSSCPTLSLWTTRTKKKIGYAPYASFSSRDRSRQSETDQHQPEASVTERCIGRRRDGRRKRRIKRTHFI